MNVKAIERAVARKAKTEYHARGGVGLSDDDAQIIGAELERLARGGVDLTIDNIVEKAEDKASPLHKYVYDKTQREAAKAYFRERAYELVRHIVVRVKISGDQVEARAFHPSVRIIEDGRQHVYEPRAQILESRQSLALVEQRLMASIRAALREAKSLGLTRRGKWKALEGAAGWIVDA